MLKSASTKIKNTPHKQQTPRKSSTSHRVKQQLKPKLRAQHTTITHSTQKKQPSIHNSTQPTPSACSSTPPLSSRTPTTSTPLRTPISTTFKQTNPQFYYPSQDFSPTGKPIHRATTILCVRKGDKVVMIGDGQVSMGPTIVKPNAKKIRRIGSNNDVIVGFAGSTADAFTLLGLLENQLEQHPGQLLRASVETAKLWRTDKMSRHLEAMLIASDSNISLCISGNGDVIESHDGLLGIGSGSTYALAAARALFDIDGMDSMAIATKAMNIAADICVYTNHNFVIDEIKIAPETPLHHNHQPGEETSLSSPIVQKM